MISRYNPHKIQKNTKSFLCEPQPQNLIDDVKQRLIFLWANTVENQFYPQFDKTYIPTDFLEEYGIDVCRLYSLMEGENSTIDEKLFESNYRWISALFTYFTSKQIRPFNIKKWLLAIHEANDYALGMNKYNLALSKVKNAIKISPPNIDLNYKEKKLVLGAIYPFIPVLSSYLLHINNLCEVKNLNIKKMLIEDFSEYNIIRFAIQKSGWRWAIFKKQDFENDKKMAFRSICGFNKITNNRDFDVLEEGENYRICLKI